MQIHMKNPDKVCVFFMKLQSTEFLIVDDEGCNIANASVKKIPGKTKGLWIYQDNIEGFFLFDQHEIDMLTLIIKD